LRKNRDPLARIPVRAKIPEGVRFAAAALLVASTRTVLRKNRDPLARIPVRAKIPEGVRFAAAAPRFLSAF
jgi:hypothetical protein